MATIDLYLSELMKFPPEERAKAARALLESLDEGTTDPDAGDAWIEEIVGRLRSIEDGTADLVDGNDVRRRVQDRLRSLRASS